MLKHRYLIAATAVVLCSCLESPRRLTTAPHEEIKIQNAVEGIPQLTKIVSDNNDLMLIANKMLANAENMTLDRNFEGAQNLISLIFEILPLSDENNEDTDDFLYRVARFYIEKMPPQYFDSIPQSIAAFVLRLQFEMFMSEIDTANVDWSQIPLMNCIRDVEFNIPIVFNARVQQAFATLLAPNRHDRMIRFLDRMALYQPFMKEMYREAGLPTDIVYLPLLESGFNPRAYSVAHASGIWQFIPSTGNAFNLRQNHWLDERRDPIKSTQASIRYFTQLYNLFGDWHLALAAYNTGQGRVRRLINARRKELIESGVPESEINITYWDLRLPRETMYYVPLYTAFKVIAKNPRCFGFFADTTIVPFPFDTVKVSESIEMSRIARAVGISPDSLRFINPHIRQFVTPPDMPNVNLFIPKGTREAFREFFESLTPEDRIRWHRHRVVAGDNLNNLARRFGTTAQAIRDINRMRNNTLVVGRHILIPIPHNENLERIIAEEQRRAAAQPATATATATRQQQPATGNRVNYRVSSGETLASIARLYGVSVNDLMAWNPNIRPRFLKVGHIVIIYTDGRRAGQPAPAAAQTQAQAQAQTSTPAAPATTRQSYIVQSGDNLFQISRRLNVRLSDLIAWNNKDANNPIIIPGETLVYYTNAPAQTAQTQARTQTAARPSAPQAQTTAPVSSAAVFDTINYRVNRGDTFFSIARNFSSTVAELEALNNMTANQLQAGQTIRVVNRATPSTRVQPSATAAAQTQTETNGNGMIRHRVQSGDNLHRLASRFNVSVQDIALANNFSTTRQLRIGETINIPVKR